MAKSPRENAQLEVRKRDIKTAGRCLSKTLAYVTDNTWEIPAKNRSAWRAGITSGADRSQCN